MKVHRITGGGAIADSTDAMTGDTYLDCIMVHFDAAPSTSEDLTLTVDSVGGAAYDTVVYSVDPSVGSLTDIVVTPSDLGIPLLTGDVLTTAYTNTDTNTVGITYLLR